MKLKRLIAGLICGLAALAADSGTAFYTKALTQERNGKLDEAIKLYQSVAKEFASDRALAAKALMAAAHCYELQGQEKQANAIKLYEQVRNDYGDQRQAVETARAKIALLRPGNRAAQPGALQLSGIEPLGEPTIFGPQMYTDGQRAVYLDATNSLVIGNLDGGNKRVVYKPKPGESLAFVPSRDLSMVSMLLFTPGQQTKRAVIKIDGTGYHELFQGHPYGGAPPAWSWDNRYLLFAGVPPGPAGGNKGLLENGESVAVGGGVAVVSVADGKSREVVRLDASVQRAAFSPDGRFIAFSDEPPASWTGKTFVVPVQGGEPKLISEEASLLDWTRDGRYLAVSSKRAGSAALWLLPIEDGQLAGDPVFVRNGGIMTGDTLPSGALLYQSIRTGSRAATVATLDSNGRLGAWKRLDLKINGNDPGVGDMSWSPDSTQIVYGSTHEDAGQPGTAIRLHNVVSGEDRELYRGADQTGCFWWETKRANLLCLEIGRQNGEVVSVALDSGRAERLGSIPRGEFDAVKLLREKGIEFIGSADFNEARSLARVVNRRDLEVRSTPDGVWKHLVSFNATQPPVFEIEHSLDGKWIFYGDNDSAGKDSLFRISTTGGQPERLGDLPAQYRWSVRGIHVSPDGRNILLEGGTGSMMDSWLLENFEPKAPIAR